MLLSESQERMLVVAKAGHEDEVIRILEKWELEAAVIGVVTDDGLYRVREGDRVVAEIPGMAIVDCPTYTREGIESEEVRRLRGWDPGELSTLGDGHRGHGREESQDYRYGEFTFPAHGHSAFLFLRFRLPVFASIYVRPRRVVVRLRGLE
jgi:hypothetical protein